jgi:hypothetical protein
MKVRNPVRIAASPSRCKTQALHARFSNKKGAIVSRVMAHT